MDIILIRKKDQTNKKCVCIVQKMNQALFFFVFLPWNFECYTWKAHLNLFSVNHTRFSPSPSCKATLCKKTQMLPFDRCHNFTWHSPCTWWKINIKCQTNIDLRLKFIKRIANFTSLPWETALEIERVCFAVSFFPIKNNLSHFHFRIEKLISDK